MSNVSIDKSFLKIDGNAKSATTATKLSTARTIQTNLASTSTASFDGSKNITPGVTGVLPVANGGTGSGTKNFVDLSTAQTINGNKTFNSAIINGHLKFSNGTEMWVE